MTLFDIIKIICLVLTIFYALFDTDNWLNSLRLKDTRIRGILTIILTYIITSIAIIGIIDMTITLIRGV